MKENDSINRLVDLRYRAMYELQMARIQNSSLEVDLILTYLLDVQRAYLHSHPEHILEPEMISRFNNMLNRRLSGEPLQYILGRTCFFGYEIEVGSGVLIPRPETEILVEEALTHFQKGTFLDWGTGSGCITIAILRETNETQAIALEKDPKALAWAWKNLNKYKLLPRALLLHLDAMGHIPVGNDTLDLIVSNPPYVESITMPDLDPSVRSHEPHMALDGGTGGLEPFFPILKIASLKLRKGAHLIVECSGTAQARYLESASVRGLVHSFTKNDLCGIPRIVGWCRV